MGLVPQRVAKELPRPSQRSKLIQTGASRSQNSPKINMSGGLFNAGLSPAGIFGRYWLVLLAGTGRHYRLVLFAATGWYYWLVFGVGTGWYSWLVLLAGYTGWCYWLVILADITGWYWLVSTHYRTWAFGFVASLRFPKALRAWVPV